MAFTLRHIEQENFLKKGGTGKANEWKLLCEIRDTIDAWKDEISLFLSFDPAEAMKRLTKLHDALISIKEHKIDVNYHFKEETNNDELDEDIMIEDEYDVEY